MESTRKIGQDRYFLKILTFWSTFVQKSTFGNWTFAQFLSFEWRNGSQNRNVLEKLSGIGPFWKFWLFGQGQGSTWSKHFLFLLFFLFKIFCSWFGPGQVSRSVKPVSGRCVISDIIVLEVSGGWRHQWRHSAGGLGGAWRRVSLRWWTPMLPEARGSFFGLEISGLCWSKAVEDHGIVSFQK